jgi:prepilin-type N-terminal cleavage/methylation domain-containing protein
MRHAVRRGFTLVELLIVISVIAILTLSVFFAPSQSPRRSVDDAARNLQMDLSSSLSLSLLRGEDVAVTFDPGGGSEARGRWVIQRIAGGDPFPVPTDSAWTSLEAGVTFMVGNATVAPTGAALGDALPRATFLCDASGTCDLGGDAQNVFYLGHVDDPDVLSALVVTASARVSRYTWNATTGAWE